MRRFSKVTALAANELPATDTDTKAQASIVARLGPFGGVAVAIMIFISFGVRVALAADTANFHSIIAPVENEHFFNPSGNSTAVIGSGVNNAGVIVGRVEDSSGQHGFYFADGTFSEFNCPSATQTDAEGINAANVIVGGCFDATNGWQAFFAYPGVFNKFKYPNSIHTLATAINDNNVIVGSFSNGAGNWSGWWYFNGQSGPLQYPGAASTEVNAINNSNVICGDATGQDGHKFGFYRSNNLVYTAFRAPGATDTICTGVSDDNQLVGYYLLSDGSYHSFVAGPGQFTTGLGPASASNTKISSIMPNGVSLVGQYTIDNTTYGFATGNAGWPVKREISPLAGKSFIGSNVLLLQGISYAFALTFHADGTVGYYTNAETRTNEGCTHDDTYDWSGSFYVQSLSLHLDNLQGQHTVRDSCFPSQNTQIHVGPLGPYTIQWWEIGIATDGTMRLYVTDTGQPPLDNLLLVKG